MTRVIHALVRRGERAWVAECQEIAVVTQGTSLDETITNLQEAVALHLEGEDLASWASRRSGRERSVASVG
jgi:predicted RNase H-like HicB family nuclease